MLFGLKVRLNCDFFFSSVVAKDCVLIDGGLKEVCEQLLPVLHTLAIWQVLQRQLSTHINRGQSMHANKPSMAGITKEEFGPQEERRSWVRGLITL